MAALAGLHHVTAICSDPQQNLDFYTHTLGLRLVKLTVNFDDPGTYHFYYGDELGRPGTVLTFFAWPGAPRGQIGPPQATATALAVPADALDFWTQRLREHRVISERPFGRFGEMVLPFVDPDGMRLELVATPEPLGKPWSGGSVPLEHAIRGFHGVTLSQEGYENTAKLLMETMHFHPLAEEGTRFRYRAEAGDGFAALVDLVCAPDARRGSLGAGIVHHVAFRTPDDDQQQMWRSTIARGGFNISPVMDRNYFHSIYFREPGGVLFEIATETPGFTIDEPAETLGTHLKLPAWAEAHRAELERFLPKLKLSGSGAES